MCIGKKISLFVPPIFYRIKKRLFPHSLVNPHPLPMREVVGKRMVIVGNGPSLNSSIEQYETEIQDADTIMVNHSASTPMFERIRPKIYVMTDSEIVSNGTIKAAIERLVDNLVEKTQWPMTMVLPSSFCGWWALPRLAENQNITIVFDYARWLEYPETELFPYFRDNILHTPNYTVLTYCLYLALYWGYSETYIVGADTTFPTVIYVGQDDNLLYTVDTHFYQNESVRKEDAWDPVKHGRRSNMNMEQYMQMCYMVFYEYNLLARYAKWKGLKVYNASEFSMIDCFERKKLRNENDNEKI